MMMNCLAKKTPLAFSIAIAVSTFQSVAVAGHLSNSEATVMSGDTSEDWTLAKDATLSVKPGGETGRIYADASTVNLDKSTTLTNSNGVELQRGSVGNISGASITSTGAFGLQLSGNDMDGSRSRATVMDSQISGVGRGVSVSLSDLVMSGTEVYAKDDGVSGFLGGGVGMAMIAGTAQVTNRSTVVGDKHGVLVSPNNASGTAGQQSSLTVDNSIIQGISGSAIIVGSFSDTRSSDATIVIQNGSTLLAGNGVLVEVANNSKADVTVDNSHLVGDVVAEAGSTANLTLDNGATLLGHLDNVATLAVNNNARWTLTQDASVADISMSGGAIALGKDPSDFYRLSIENLSGSGTFIMPANFQTGQVGFLDVTGVATGNYQLLVAGSGVDPRDERDLHIVHTASGDANFSLIGGYVDAGAYSYGLVESTDGRDWYLDPNKKIISPSTSTVLALFNTAPTVWYGELSTLRSRMGEVRMGNGAPGLWSRGYGNKYSVSTSSGVGYQQNQQGISFGADGRLPIGDGQWLAGLIGGYSKSDLSLSRGSSGTVDSYYVGAYTTWLDAQSGFYFDGVVKLNRFENDAKVSMSDGAQAKGDYTTHGIGASAEFGRHIKLDNGYFVEPFTQLSGITVQGKDYGLDNGMEAKGDRTHSLLGKLGTTIGRNFDFGGGHTVQPYVRAAYAHEFAKTNEVQVNATTFNNDLSGSRGELGAGIAVAMSDKVSIHADFDYSNGKNIEQPWGANVGLRYSW